MTTGTTENIPDISSVKAFWNENPVSTVEFGKIQDPKSYFEMIDDLRWKDNEKWAEPVFYNLPGNTLTKLLDAGCGIGVFTRYYARKGFNVYGIDLSSESLKWTKKSLDLFSLNAKLFEGSVEELPFEDNYFDYIVSNGVIHHTPNTEKAVSEFYRVLKPGGKVTVAVYYKNALLSYPLWGLTRRVLPFFLKKKTGREKMLLVDTPEQLALNYDGNNCPIAKIYSLKEADSLFKVFKILKSEPHFFPSRFLRGFPVGGAIHKFLDNHFGTMIYYLLEKSKQKI